MVALYTLPGLTIRVTFRVKRQQFSKYIIAEIN